MSAAPLRPPPAPFPCLSIANPASPNHATPWEMVALLPKFKKQLLRQEVVWGRHGQILPLLLQS